MDDKIKSIIESNCLAFATINKDKTPHNIVVGDVKVFDNNLLIGDNYMEITKSNLSRNPNVSLVVWNKEGYRIDGAAFYYNKGEWMEKVKEIHKGYPAKGAILVKIKKVEKLL